MKKSEKYNIAILAVVECAGFPATTRAEVIEMLISERNIAELVEKMEEEKNG